MTNAGPTLMTFGETTLMEAIELATKKRRIVMGMKERSESEMVERREMKSQK